MLCCKQSGHQNWIRPVFSTDSKTLFHVRSVVHWWNMLMDRNDFPITCLCNYSKDSVDSWTFRTSFNDIAIKDLKGVFLLFLFLRSSGEDYVNITRCHSPAEAGITFNAVTVRGCTVINATCHLGAILVGGCFFPTPAVTTLESDHCKVFQHKLLLK
jgi:hypothetical protein